jgi:hypothetical protein
MSLIVAHPQTVLAEEDRPFLDVIEHVIPQEQVRAVVEQYRHGRERNRKLPGPLLVLLFITQHLVPPVGLDMVLATLLAGRRARTPGSEPRPASKSAISHARYRWGVRPLNALFHQLCHPLATPTTQGAWLGSFRLMAIDSSIDDVVDTPQNARAFGRPDGLFAYPQFMGMYLSECGTRAIVDAGIWPCHADIHRAARRMLRTVTSGMVVLWDQGLHSFNLAHGTRQQGAHFLSRVSPQQTFDPIRVLPDGSLLARLWGAAPSRHTVKTEFLVVRVLTYTITDPDRTGYQEEHRLMTSLLDHTVFPAMRLICAYHERWEIELVFDELGNRLRLTRVPFRAKHPIGVLQEVYGLLLAHYAVRAVIHDAACRASIDPDRVSFLHAVRLIALALPIFQVVEPARHEALYTQLLDDLVSYQLPHRLDRAAPRECKRPRSKHRLRRRDRPYRTIRLRPFAEVIALVCPMGFPPCPSPTS